MLGFLVVPGILYYLSSTGYVRPLDLFWLDSTLTRSTA